MNYLNKRIGIIGGGQLGKMMILDAKRLGFYVITLDPTPNCPSHSISDEHIVADFNDVEAIKLLAEKSDVITYEFEHISTIALRIIENQGHKVYPTVENLEIIQNKYTQKTVLKEKGIPVPEFVKINQLSDIYEAAEIFTYPLMLKTCTGGYDGKGNGIIKNKESVKAIFQILGNGDIPLMVEKYIPYRMEISVLACRGIDGDIVVYPVAWNNHKDSILDETIVPAPLSEETSKSAMELAHNVMEIFHGVGMFCVEMFVNHNDDLFVNEVAPRPHNSGHYTIEGCMTSQFEQHIRAITGLPFGDVSLRHPIVMRNILGKEFEDGKALVKGIEEALKLPHTKVHIYGKEEVKSKRKMGHLISYGTNIEEARLEAGAAINCIEVIAEN